jgi:2-amino-4-hydroxy-6-hydroxymethyldihydropteridine diphosphokinase
MAMVFLGLGSNLGNREGNILLAEKLLKEKINVKKVSSIYESSPEDSLSQPFYLNSVVMGETLLSPEELLYFTQEVEKKIGRKFKGDKRSRLIDIDILFYNDQKIKTPHLKISHPKIHKRIFVLLPLKEIGFKVNFNRKDFKDKMFIYKKRE